MFAFKVLRQCSIIVLLMQAAEKPSHPMSAIWQADQQTQSQQSACSRPWPRKLGNPRVTGRNRLKAGRHDSPVSGGPVHHRFEAIYDVRHRAHSCQRCLSEPAIHRHNSISQSGPSDCVAVSLALTGLCMAERVFVILQIRGRNGYPDQPR